MTTLKQLVRHRPRLFIAAAAGLVLALLLPAHWAPVTRGLTAWDFSVWSYLLLMSRLMMRAGPTRVRRIAAQEDTTAVAVVAILCAAAVLSLAAGVVELGTIKGLPDADKLPRYLFVATTVAGSWALLGVLFTFHYAHMFYAAPDHQKPLAFPDQEHAPDYWDFLYFSFTIAVAAQTSDICVQTHAMRKTVLAQSVLSFFFNTAVIGFTINIAAGMIG